MLVVCVMSVPLILQLYTKATVTHAHRHTQQCCQIEGGRGNYTPNNSSARSFLYVCAQCMHPLTAPQLANLHDRHTHTHACSQIENLAS